MARLIDADELSKDDEVIAWVSNDAIRTGKQLKMFSELFLKKIADAPTVDAQPVIHAEWIEHTDNYSTWVECSVCGTERAYPTNYCPDCGARMDKESKDG